MKSASKNIISAYAASLMLALFFSSIASAQQVQDVKRSAKPLVLKDRGSLVIGGTSIDQTREQLSSITGVPPAQDGHITIDQMYVDYMIPQNTSGLPIVLVHGATLSGKTYDTTPDGRMGWYEYFVRKGHATYVVDQSSRARSGVDISTYNDVRTGKQPPTALPNAFRISQEDGLAQFRIGIRNGKPFADTQFPVEALDALAAQSIPDFNASLPQPNPTYANLAILSRELGGAVVVGHSEGGAYPLHAALADSANVKKMILIEPGTCHDTAWTPAQMKTFAAIPTLVVFGDHLDAKSTVEGFTWQSAYTDCERFVSEVNAVGGNATMLYLPDHGMKGNSHLLIMDRNNLKIADLLLGWISKKNAASNK
ncbi:alpha/beta fold hydrolase [Paraburkholderia sp. JHI869]|uniref:alpha/beta fold hydrolase n=1 Tax=Paraburkholderia sp. JHI869 TaxID=3112959 RepID=UPI003178CAE5